MKRLIGLSPLARVQAHLIEQPTGCYEWEGCCSKWGYPQVRIAGRVVCVHKWLWEQVHGPVPSGWEVDHLCRNQKCGLLAHLEAVPKRINGLRGTSPAAQHAKKTTCPNGHPYDRFWKSRRCRRCATANAKILYRRKKGLPCDLSVSLRARGPNRRYRASDHGELSPSSSC